MRLTPRGWIVVLALTLALVFVGATFFPHLFNEPSPALSSISYESTPCANEDSSNCYWHAPSRGNGEGRSFVSAPDGIWWLSPCSLNADYRYTPCITSKGVLR